MHTDTAKIRKLHLCESVPHLWLIFRGFSQGSVFPTKFFGPSPLELQPLQRRRLRPDGVRRKRAVVSSGGGSCRRHESANYAPLPAREKYVDSWKALVRLREEGAHFRERMKSDEARAALVEAVQPAYADVIAWYKADLPNADVNPSGVGTTHPDGAAYYAERLAASTTTDLTPDQVHQIGLDEVARIRAEMDEVIEQTGFEGSFPEFLHFLRTDPQFYAKTPQELLNHAAWIAKRVDAVVGDYIGTLPRARFTIVPVPPEIAPFWTAGRGGNNTYWLNTYDLPSRPLYNLPALTLHEASPGHALQGALAKEQDTLPDFRRKTYISAFGEGWGLYVEKLGEEMGIYETPYQQFGRLTYEMWRACRLVIDTGVHHKGWTRDQAIAYLRGHSALSEHEVVTEVDRYISWPAQALSYKLGELAIVRLRGEAEQALGADFDIKAFHDMVLALGSVPLPVLETQVRAFIADSVAAAKLPDSTG